MAVSDFPRIRVPLTVPWNQYWHEQYGYIIRMDDDDVFAAWEDRNDPNCNQVKVVTLGIHEFVHGPIPMEPVVTVQPDRNEGAE